MVLDEVGRRQDPEREGEVGLCEPAADNIEEAAPLCSDKAVYPVFVGDGVFRRMTCLLGKASDCSLTYSPPLSGRTLTSFIPRCRPSLPLLAANIQFTSIFCFIGDIHINLDVSSLIPRAYRCPHRVFIATGLQTSARELGKSTSSCLAYFLAGYLIELLGLSCARQRLEEE
jgi:hypothetical protein